MPNHAPVDPNFETRVRTSFARQPFMATLGATLRRVEPGKVEILLPCRRELSQQHGFTHAGAVSAIGDTACGYAAFTLMPADAGVLTVEFKINLLAPARGDRLIARGQVLRAGRTLSVCQAEISALTNDSEEVVALLTATVMTIRNRAAVQG